MARRGTLALAMAVAITACSDSAAPRDTKPTLRIVPVADSVFEGDFIRLNAIVLDASGDQVPGATVAWTDSDPALAQSFGDGSFALLKPGTVRIEARSGSATATYDLVIGGLVVKRVDLTPATLDIGRGDQVQVSVRTFGQGDRPIAGHAITFAADDPRVASIGAPINPVGGPGFLTAVGAGSTTIRATVDGVTGTARANVVIADTTLTLTEFQGAKVPVLISSDSVLIDGVPELAEVVAESGTLVLSGIKALRYQVDVRIIQYRVTRIDGIIQRVPRFEQHRFDRGLATVAANGDLAMTSELVFPLAHTATAEPDGFRVRFNIAGDDSFFDLRFKR